MLGTFHMLCVILTPTLKSEHYYPHFAGMVLKGELAQDRTVKKHRGGAGIQVSPPSLWRDRWALWRIPGVFVHTRSYGRAVVLGSASRGRSEAVGPGSWRTLPKDCLVWALSAQCPRLLSRRLPWSPNLWAGEGQTLPGRSGKPEALFLAPAC